MYCLHDLSIIQMRRYMWHHALGVFIFSRAKSGGTASIHKMKPKNVNKKIKFEVFNGIA